MYTHPLAPFTRFGMKSADVEDNHAMYTYPLAYMIAEQKRREQVATRHVIPTQRGARFMQRRFAHLRDRGVPRLRLDQLQLHVRRFQPRGAARALTSRSDQ